MQATALQGVVVDNLMVMETKVRLLLPPKKLLIFVVKTILKIKT
jgi:hypothetical protein